MMSNKFLRLKLGEYEITQTSEWTGGKDGDGVNFAWRTKRYLGSFAIFFNVQGKRHHAPFYEWRFSPTVRGMTPPMAIMKIVRYRFAALHGKLKDRRPHIMIKSPVENQNQKGA